MLAELITGGVGPARVADAQADDVADGIGDGYRQHPFDHGPAIAHEELAVALLAMANSSMKPADRYVSFISPFRFSMQKRKSMLLDWAGLRPRRVLPALDVVIEVGFENGSFVAPNPWQRATGRKPGQTDPVCRLSLGVSPLHDRIYVDELWVDDQFRRQRYASALLVAVADRMSPPGTRLAITALHEVGASNGFWSTLRAGAVPGLTVTTDVRVSEMDREAQRWKSPAEFAERSPAAQRDRGRSSGAQQARHRSLHWLLQRIRQRGDRT